jgi:hypothetical protein
VGVAQPHAHAVREPQLDRVPAGAVAADRAHGPLDRPAAGVWRVGMDHEPSVAVTVSRVGHGS